MPVPTGYCRLPNGVKCRCLSLRQKADGSLWCCKGASVDSAIAAVCGNCQSLRRSPSTQTCADCGDRTPDADRFGFPKLN